MSEQKTVAISSLIALGLVLAGIITPTFFDQPKYFCEERPEIGVVSCDGFSKYVAENGKCIRDDDTNLICRSGWSLVTNDLVLPEENLTEDDGSNSVVWGRQYECNNTGCKEIIK